MFWTNFGRNVCNVLPIRLLRWYVLDQFWSILPWARSGLFHYEPDLVYFTISQVWSISLWARSSSISLWAKSGLFTMSQINLLWAKSGLFTMSQIWSIFCEPDLVYFKSDLFHYGQIWSISLWAKSGLFHYEPDLAAWYGICLNVPLPHLQARSPLPPPICQRTLRPMSSVSFLTYHKSMG